MLAFQTKDTDSNFLQQFTFWFYIHFNEFLAVKQTMESEITTLCFASKLRFWLGRLILALAAAGGDIACRWLGLTVERELF